MVKEIGGEERRYREKEWSWPCFRDDGLSVPIKLVDAIFYDRRLSWLELVQRTPLTDVGPLSIYTYRRSVAVFHRQSLLGCKAVGCSRPTRT